jgi:4-amino-4-deoxychorismate lyase
MCLLLETIKIVNGKPQNLDYHQARFENTQKSLLGLKNFESLSKTIKVPEFAQNGLFRCRVIYSKSIEKIEFLSYNFRQIKTLRLIESNGTDYSFKYADRTELENLFAQKGDCDDIFIVKNGLITDSFAANLVFYDGEKWWTPDSPLLKGTKREKLLAEKIISACKIEVSDLNKYSSIGLINAMIEFDTMPVIPIENIRF